MALKKVGVEFVAQNAEAYFAAMAKGVTATGQMGSAATAAAAQSTALDTAQLKLASQITRTTDTIANQKRQYALLEQSLATTTAKYGEGSTQAQKQQLALDKLSSSIANNERSLAILHKELADGAGKGSKWGETLTGALRRVGEMATNLAMDAGRKMIDFFKGSVTAAADFESGLQRFGAVTGLASGQLQQFNALFLDLGKQTQYSAAQAEEAAINLAKGGIEPATIAAGALHDTLALAAAGELELGVAAEVTAKQLGVWSDQGVTAADVANLMSQAANASTVGVQDLALGMSNVGDVAKIAGLSFQETVQTMAMIAPGFSSAADAGTSFKTFLTNLTPTSRSAIDAMTELGLITADGTNKFYDANGAFVGMQQAAQLLQGATEGLTESQKKQLLATAFGTDAIRVAARVAENGASGFLAMGASMEKAGSATDQAAKRQQGYNYAAEQAAGSMETLQITIGQKLLPVMTQFQLGLAKAANSLIDFFSAADKRETIAKNIERASTSFEQYSATIDKVNDQLPWYIADTQKLNKELYEYNKALQASGMSLEQVAAKTQAASGYSRELDYEIQQLRTYFPQYAEAIDGASNSLIMLNQAGGSWGQQAQALLDQLVQTGNVEQFQTAIANLTTQMQQAQGAIGIEGGGFSASLQQLGLDASATSGDMAGLNDAAMRYATITPTATAATAALGASMLPTAERAKELAKELENIATKGQQSLDKLIAGQVQYQLNSQSAQTEHDAAMQLLQQQYNSATTEAERTRIQQMITDEQTGFEQQSLQRAAAYGTERMEQQAHLGEMLIAHIQAWGEMNGVAQSKINEMTGVIAEKYGVAADSTSMLFGQMTSSMQDWALNGQGSAQAVVDAMLQTQNAATQTQTRIAGLTAAMKAELDAQLAANKININEYNAALRSIPGKVSTLLEVEERITRNYDEGMADAAAQHGAPQAGQGRAYGGRVAEGSAYLVGESGRPEMFVPDQSGYVMPPSSQPTMNTYNSQTSYASTYHYAPTYSGAPPSPDYDFMMMEARSTL